MIELDKNGWILSDDEFDKFSENLDRCINELCLTDVNIRISFHKCINTRTMKNVTGHHVFDEKSNTSVIKIKTRTLGLMIKTLFHELRHVWQYKTNVLTFEKPYYVWKNVIVNDDYNIKGLPWEDDAILFAHKFCQK